MTVVVSSDGQSVTISGDGTSVGLAPGPPGPAGADGADGADGTQGVPGDDGADGADGAQGADGADGAAGADGADGDDATAIYGDPIGIAHIPTGTTGTTVPFGNDIRFTDARTPTAHAASHADGGVDELVIDGSQITTGTVADARIAATIARDSEVTSAVSGEATARDVAIAAHTADTTAAHAASAVSFAPNGSIAATDVQTAIQEVRDEAAGGGAPSTVDYLVGTADAGLSNEIAVGTTPGGELGGTWAAPTVDATHSGSSHAATQAAAEATAAAALTAHTGDAVDAHVATAIGFTPAGTIAATTVQAAIEEVASEAGGGGAPTTADYLVATAQGGLSAEIVVGATPGGELGGTWASPTVDATHSGSSHAATQAAAEATAAAALTAHTGDTADAHDATAVSFTPNGSIAATDVQAAIQEVRDEAAGGGAPSTVNYLVGTADGTLSAEIVVGTTPGGELGGTWAAPTVDATHSGSTHAATQAAAEATAAAALSAHTGDATDAHDATAVSFAPTGTIAATTVQAAIAEVSDDVTDIPQLAVNADGLSLATAAGVSTITNTNALVATAKTTTYTAVPRDFVIGDTTGGAFTVTLPSAPANGAVIAVKLATQGASNLITVARGGSDVFDDGATSVVTPALGWTIRVQYRSADGTWYVFATPPAALAGGAPSTANYLVGTADAGLSAEIAVGATPNGELGGTWGAITVDANHGGSTHAAVQAAAEVTAQAALDAHTADATDAHDASAISVVSTTLVGTGVDAQAVFEELDNAIVAAETATANHLADTVDAHDASAISFAPDGSIAATTVQAAIVEVRDEAAGGGAPTTADYLVGTTQGGLSAEIVVGATPGGELGGTWASPTVDATHSGSSHAATQAAAEATAQAALDAHTTDATDAHDASAISVVSTTLVGTGTDAQAVFEELDNQVATNVTDIAGKQPLDADLTTIAGLTATTDNMIQSVGSAWASRTPAQVRTALALVLGTNVQAWDADLDALAALATTSFGRSVLTQADAAALRTLSGSVIGTNVQAFDADLSTLAGLTATTDSFLQSKSSAWAARTVAQVQADLLSSASGEAIIRANTLNQMAAPTANLDLNGQRLVTVADGVADDDAATVGQLPTMIDRQTFTADGTWTKPAGVSASSMTLIRLVGSGAGGGGGRVAATGATRGGGGGGGAGGVTERWIATSLLGATEAVAVGAGGTGGAGGVGPTNNGGVGSTNTPTTFGTTVIAVAGGGTKGTGGTTAAGTGGPGGFPCTSANGLVAGGALTGGYAESNRGGTGGIGAGTVLAAGGYNAFTLPIGTLSPGAGGGGGGITSGTTTETGFGGGDGEFSVPAGGVGAAGANGTNGANAAATGLTGGGGAGGASRNGAGNGYAGGAGGTYGGGGGGGGASDGASSSNGGAGGAGGGGFAEIITWI